MKKFNIIKTIQLIILLVFLVLCAYLIFFDKGLYFAISQDRNLRMLCWMLWACFGINFIFVFMDFGFSADYKRDYRELDYAVHSDPVSGLANRNSCDAILDKYADKPLPKGIGCVMIELSNIGEINKRLGHKAGNEVIADFANILKMASVSLCFVGRNGGNRFLAVFEGSTREQIDAFLERLSQKVRNHNEASPERIIEYGFGVAFEESQVETINELVALSARRIVH